ncbi:MAG: ribosome maturation factor RimP [Acidobacteriales bacterium]|nr:ribosome maturation factor RimP [Terriglobales bacterium]
MAFDLEKVREICDRVALSLGLEIMDVEFLGGAGKQGRVLRITLDRVPQPDASVPSGEGAVLGVTLDDCANVSREVSTILDVEDVVPVGEYVLEVSSPGLDRPLTRPRDFERFVGSRMKLMTREPLGVTETSKGNRHFEGRLESFADGVLKLDLSESKKHRRRQKRHGGGEEKIEIAFENIERAHLVPEL